MAVVAAEVAAVDAAVAVAGVDAAVAADGGGLALATSPAPASGILPAGKQKNTQPFGKRAG